MREREERKKIAVSRREQEAKGKSAKKSTLEAAEAAAREEAKRRTPLATPPL